MAIASASRSERPWRLVVAQNLAEERRELAELLLAYRDAYINGPVRSDGFTVSMYFCLR